jgi:hypothetical protein
MTTGSVHSGLATKVVYLSITTAVFVFVVMLLLTGLHN